MDIGIAFIIAEHPANVRVEEALHRAVRVALTVGERVMFDMRGGPLERRPLDGH